MSRACCWSPPRCSAWSTASPTRPRTAGTRRPPTGSSPRAWRLAWCSRCGRAGLLGIFLFLTYYLQQTLGYSPLVTGLAFLPMSGGLIVAANLSTIVLMPRFGPKPLVGFGMLAASGGTAWLAQLGPHTGYT